MLYVHLCVLLMEAIYEVWNVFLLCFFPLIQRMIEIMCESQYCVFIDTIFGPGRALY